MSIEFDQSPVTFSNTIKVIGVGGAGGNAVNTMISKGLKGVEFIVANTDIMDLQKSKAQTKVQIGTILTKGHGGGADPKIGREAALESKEELKKAIAGADMLFISAGLGGGTGTGAAPVVAEIARDLSILTLAIVTKPLKNENSHRMQNFDHGLVNLRQFVDSFIVIPNDKMTEIDNNLSVFEVFGKADEVIYDATKAMSDIITKRGYINVDFADVKAVIANNGCALVGTSICDGEDRAIRAASGAISNPLLNDIKLNGCKALLINVTAGKDALFSEFEEITSIFNNETGNNTNTITGLLLDEEMEGKICVTVFASGIIDETQKKLGIPPLVHINNTELRKRSADDLIRAQSGTDNIISASSPPERQSQESRMVPKFMQKFKD